MITFETQEDFETAVKRYIEGNLRVHADRVYIHNPQVGEGDNMLVDIYFTLEDRSNVFIST